MTNVDRRRGRCAPALDAHPAVELGGSRPCGDVRLDLDDRVTVLVGPHGAASRHFSTEWKKRSESRRVQSVFPIPAGSALRFLSTIEYSLHLVNGNMKI